MPDAFAHSLALPETRRYMAQDFAKRRVAPESGRRPSRAATRVADEGPATHWSWFFSGLFCGFLVVGIGYLGLIRLDAGSTGPGAEAENRGEEAANNRPVFDFGFYGELENAEISVATPDTAPLPDGKTGTVDGRQANETVAVAPAAVQARYLLQAGSFQDRQDAENRRAKIILLNMNASVVPGVVSGRTWHRVQVGPFNGRAAADDARDVLSENNIDSIPLLVRE